MSDENWLEYERIREAQERCPECQGTWAAVYDNVDDLVTDVALIHDKIHDESIKYTPDRLKVLFRDHIYKPLKVLTTTEEYRAKKWSSG